MTILFLNRFVEFWDELYGFLISPEFQAVVTALIGLVGAVALIANRIGSMKLANSTIATAKQNIEISQLKKDNDVLTKHVQDLKSMISQQSTMFSLAFLNSKKLDAKTKQEIAKISSNLVSLEKNIGSRIGDADKVIAQAKEAVKTVAETPIETIIEKTQSIFDKLTKS